MGTKDVLASLRRAREIKVDLGGGVSVTALRPTEEQVGKMSKQIEGQESARINIEVEDVKNGVIGWDGVTEATILGESVGSSDVLPFDKELWGELASDRNDWYFKVAMAMLESVTKHYAKRSEELKNSPPA